MPQPDPNAAIGLIVIESSCEPADNVTAEQAGQDTTLGQILHRLARGGPSDQSGAVAASPVGASRPNVRTLSGRFSGQPRSALVAADCRSLDDQLQRAARSLRRLIAERS